ncbi:unnamed protein product [Caenorhabditis sp. 36 PRJEB53466]|nr:unnamed protein product [Caenorhabditis sp. 36 PRJEB53466]
MPGDNRFYKYLVVYPFNVLSIGKITIIILLIFSLYGWDAEQKTSGTNFLLAIYDILAIGVAAVSLWFIVQKFYWLKVEAVFNIIGMVLSIASISTSFVVTLVPASIQSLTHILTLSLWIFSAFWAWRETYNNVSNLFITEWGAGTDETEIEYLEQNF